VTEKEATPPRPEVQPAGGPGRSEARSKEGGERKKKPDARFRIVCPARGEKRV